MIVVSGIGAAFLILPAQLLLGADLFAIEVLCKTVMVLPVTVAPVVVYFHLRVAREAYDVQRLAEFVEIVGERGAASAAG